MAWFWVSLLAREKVRIGSTRPHGARIDEPPPRFSLENPGLPSIDLISDILFPIEPVHHLPKPSKSAAKEG